MRDGVPILNLIQFIGQLSHANLPFPVCFGEFWLCFAFSGLEQFTYLVGVWTNVEDRNDRRGCCGRLFQF